MPEPKSVVYLDNKLMKNKLKNKIKSMPKFLDKDFFDKKTREYVIKKLDLKNAFWKKFCREIFYQMRENSYVVVRGVPFDNNNRLSVALASIIGTPLIQYNKPHPKMVRRFNPKTGSGYDENYPHTDSVYWPNSSDCLALQCVREDRNGGGKSRIVPIDLLVDELARGKSRHVIKELSRRKVPFTLDPQFGKSGMHMQYILSRKKYGSKYYDQVRFLENDIQECIRNFEVYLPKSTREAIKIFEKAAIKIGKRTEFLVRKGDWLLTDNKRSLHSRSSVSKNSIRVLKRIKMDINRDRLFGLN